MLTGTNKLLILLLKLKLNLLAHNSLVLFNLLYRPVFFTLHCYLLAVYSVDFTKERAFNTPAFSGSWQAFDVNGTSSLGLCILLCLSYLSSCPHVLVVVFMLYFSNLT